MPKKFPATTRAPSFFMRSIRWQWQLLTARNRRMVDAQRHPKSPESLNPWHVVNQRIHSLKRDHDEGANVSAGISSSRVEWVDHRGC
jgi:hypothetical protein